MKPFPIRETGRRLSRRQREDRCAARQRLAAGVLLFLGVSAGVFFLSPRSSEQPLLTVYSPEQCGECRRWMGYLETHGFRTAVASSAEWDDLQRHVPSLPPVRVSAVAMVNGLFVQGFAPAHDIHLLLRHKLGNSVIGIAARGVPPEAAGNPDAIRVSYTVFAVFPGGLLKPISDYNETSHLRSGSW